jgi:uncharacterized protein YkwD
VDLKLAGRPGDDRGQMGRVVSIAVAAVIGALGLAGCGGDPAVLHVAADVPAGAVEAPSVEPTDGRLGAATLQRAGAPLRRLSPGGSPDVRERGGSPRRDGVGAGAACANADLAPAPATLPAVAEATLCLLNGERADHGLAPLTPNGRLASAATAYANDLVAGSYFSHTGRDGSDVLERIERSGYLPRGAAWLLGENLAWGTGALSTPGSIMSAWMNSPGHRDNILNPDYREIGVAVVAGNPKAPDGRGATFATEFGAIEGEVAAVTKAARAAPEARKARRRARRASRSRSARRARAAASAKRRGKTGRVKARIAV